MNEKINIGEIIKVGLILFAITAISAALLAFVNSKTAPLIAENDIIKEQAALKNVMQGAADFKEVEITPELESLTEGKGKILKIYRAISETGYDNYGVCVITETTGYDVGIQTVTGVDTEHLVVTGVDIIAMNETPGLGAKANNDDFKEQYKLKRYEVGVSKTAATDTDIQAISGATKTSNGVTNGVNIALRVVEKMEGMR